MKLQRCVWALLIAAAVLASLGGSSANAQGRRVIVAPGYGYYQGPWTYGYNYYRYVAPLPGYGILPPPFVMMNEYGYGSTPQDLGVLSTTEGLGYIPRARNSLYPAVPYEKSPEERLQELRRVRYEITVPVEDAVVLFDGAKTKQTGLTRVFRTPPMQEGKEYTSTITVEWTEKDGTARMRSRTFSVHAGDMVRHTFNE
jgi:uncharacterized protein (TIGR03000 family)